MSLFKAKINSIKNYTSNLILIWVSVLIFRYYDYYQNFLIDKTQNTILILAISYTILALIYYIITPDNKIKPSKGLLFLSFNKKIIIKLFSIINNQIFKSGHKSEKIKRNENTALLFIIVKFFFLPLMLNFFYANLNSVSKQIPNLLSQNELFSILSFNTVIFPFILASVFMFDTLWFAFGYTFEANFLNNRVRSVEPTIIGWTVALASYPPFNSFLTKYIDWYANDYIIFFNQTFTFYFRIIIILLLLIYLSATFALGTKCSNLTNRGIVSRGPYKFIRHPAYISKNLAWWLTVLPILSLPAALSMAGWSLIYHFRSITEERHLLRDPDYQNYVKKVKYRYIPFVY